MMRAPQPADVPALAAIVAAVDLFPVAELDALLAPAFAGDPEQRWLVAGSPPLGFAYYTPERLTNGTWNLLALAVDPRCTRQGIATALVAEVERDVAATGGRILLVETSSTARFAAARAFYRACGYDDEARIRHYYDRGDDKIIFRRDLRRN